MSSHSPCGSVDWNTKYVTHCQWLAVSLPLRECGLKFRQTLCMQSLLCHSPCGSVDWNKKGSTPLGGIVVTPLAGVWIEILLQKWGNKLFKSLPLRECGLKLQSPTQRFRMLRSLPLRECGLKFTRKQKEDRWILVTPLAGVWIEICQSISLGLSPQSHSPCGSVDWNIITTSVIFVASVTPLAGVWIEIPNRDETPTAEDVTPLAGVWIEIVQK